MTLHELHHVQGAALAADGIPLHYGDLKAEYHAALERAVLMDRSHEARLSAAGRDCFALPHRISTNDLLNMAAGEGRPTIFTNPNARILERAIVYRYGDEALFSGEPGRGTALLNLIQRNIFFGDQLRLSDLSQATAQVVLHGPSADAVMDSLVPGASALAPLHGTEAIIAGVSVWIARRKPVSGSHWLIITPVEQSARIWSEILGAGKPHGLIPAGSLTYNTLRIRAGQPGMGRELSPDYIPLEIGLWDEVSFTKGCYTGQEIIARMESRRRLAKTIVTVNLNSAADTPADLFSEGCKAGTLTSSVTTPDGEHLGIGVVKMQYARPGDILTAENDAQVTIRALAGTQPAYLAPEESAEVQAWL